MLAQIYEWLLQPEKLLKPLQSMTFTLLHLIYLAQRRGVGRLRLRLVNFLSTPHPLCKTRRLEAAWETALRSGAKQRERRVSGCLKPCNGVTCGDQGSGDGGGLLQLPLGSLVPESRRAGVSDNHNPYKGKLPSFLPHPPTPSFLGSQPQNPRLDPMPPPLLGSGGARPSRPGLRLETERTACLKVGV